MKKVITGLILLSCFGPVNAAVPLEGLNPSARINSLTGMPANPGSPVNARMPVLTGTLDTLDLINDQFQSEGPSTYNRIVDR